MNHPPPSYNKEIFAGATEQWQLTCPEWTIVETFLPRDQRALARAWFTLECILQQIMNVTGDQQPMHAKMQWWQDELHQWATCRSRHPLGQVLTPFPAPWTLLADALPDLWRISAVPNTIQDARQRLYRLLSALDCVEQSLFGTPTIPPRPALDEILIPWLDARRRSGAQGIPEGISNQEWQQILLTAWPRARTTAVPRRIWCALQKQRLINAMHPHPAQRITYTWRALWSAWHAARIPRT